MKILHTADWHLGKKLDRFSRIEEQKKVMQEICTIADEEMVDLVVIAGDLFDHFNPSVEAVELFFGTLKKLSNNGKRPVIAIAGNHDAPQLIDAPNPLAKTCGIILIGQPNCIVPLLELEDFAITDTDEGFIEIQLKTFDFPIQIFHTAFANEVRLKEYFGEEKEAQLNDILAEKWSTIFDKKHKKEAVSLLLTHLYINKKNSDLIDEPDGEKPLKIGNADLVYTDSIPKEIGYTALGHLHAYQNMGSKEKPIVYSSSPLCYSFSEAGQTKYAVLVTLTPEKNATIEKKALSNGKPLYRKTFSAVESAKNWLLENQDALVELTLESDDFLKAEDRNALYACHQGIVHLIPMVKKKENSQESSVPLQLNQNIELLFQNYFAFKNGGQLPNEELMSLFSEIKNS